MSLKTLHKTEDIACTCIRQLFAFPNMVLRKKGIFTSIEYELHVSTAYEFLLTINTLYLLVW